MRFAACVLLVALPLAFYGRVWRSAPLIDGDSPQYMEVAADLADFRLDQLHDRSPGYPLLVMLSGSATSPARSLFFLSLVLHGASILLLALVLRNAGLPDRWLVWFCLLAALPPFAEPAGFVMTENLAEFMLVAGFASLMLWISKRGSALLVTSAVAFGYSGITRPAYQLLGLAVAMCLLGFSWSRLSPVLTRRVAAIAAGAVTLGTVLIVGGLSFYNARQFNYFGVAPLAGFHLTTKTILFIERAPEEYAQVRELLIRERAVELEKRGGLHDGSQTIWNARAALTTATGLSTPELSAYLLRMNLAVIRRAPLPFLRDVVESLARYWLPPGGELAGFGLATARVSWLVLYLSMAGVFLLQLATVAGLAVSDFAARLLVGGRLGSLTKIRVEAAPLLAYALAGVIVLYTMAITCLLDIGEPRQRRATDLLILFMCVTGVFIWHRTVVARSRGGQTSPGGLVNVESWRSAGSPARADGDRAF